MSNHYPAQPSIHAAAPRLLPVQADLVDRELVMVKRRLVLGTLVTRRGWNLKVKPLELTKADHVNMPSTTISNSMHIYARSAVSGVRAWAA